MLKAAVLVLFVALLLPAPRLTIELRPVLATEPVGEDADDPALWIHPSDPARSLVIGTDKTARPAGALYVFDLEGRVRQKISHLDRPNDVDVEYGLVLAGRPVDIAVVTERYGRRLRAYRIDPETGDLREISPGGLPVFEGEEGEWASPMGIALYRRPRDGVIFAIVGRKSGPRQGYLWQYRLEDGGSGQIRVTKVRELGR